MHANHASKLRLSTGGRNARRRVSEQLHFRYQDSGFESVLNDGSLDAPEDIPAGAQRADVHFRGGAMQLVGRQGAAA
jgi:hypothetical protein